MTGNDIRARFLEYFEKNGHTVVESSSLVPQNDPTLLFTNAGMVQFKTVFMGEDKRDYRRAVTSQCCMRAGGKHNDLENVGYTARHHTFFEMLGNFSFGDYFKEQAIHYAWQFLTEELQLSKEKMWVSVFQDDDEAFALWEKVDGLLPGRIIRMDEKDNFWAMGDTGPCGPCSEIHIDQGVEAGCGREDCALGCDCDRFLELWNLVFMQFNRTEEGNLEPLPKPSIDTGMGLERIAAVLQGKLNNYDSDLFMPVISRLEQLSGRSYGAGGSDDTAMRVIADHARATSFLVADGVLPSNEGRGYVLRRVMRRAIRFGRSLGLSAPFFYQACRAVVETMVGAYPRLADTAELLEKVVNNEEARFSETLEHGLAILDEEIQRQHQQAVPRIDGEFIFKLYDTHGFPFDIVRDVCLERAIAFDESGFQAAMERQRRQSRASRKGEGLQLKDAGIKTLIDSGRKTEFVGYHTLHASAAALALFDEWGQPVETLRAGESGRLFVDQTPFYAESGGQVGDHGTVIWTGGRAEVTAVRTEAEGIYLHQVVVSAGAMHHGDRLELAVSSDRRQDTAANHSATHLLHAALREILGDHVKQAGSLVTPDRLRFDFTHFSALSEEELAAVEGAVNTHIRENRPVGTRMLNRAEALEEGAVALFGEKYGETVRVVQIDAVSKELCGGTHVTATGSIGLFKIVSESGIAAGVRRIEAVTGNGALTLLQTMATRESALCRRLNVTAEELPEKVESLLEQQKKLEKHVATLSMQLASSDLDKVFSSAQNVSGVRVIASRIQLDNPKTLREVGDRVRDRMGSGVAVLGGEFGGKAALLALVSKDLTGTVKAGEVVSRVAEVVGGKGGGRPDMAQAGGPLADKLDEALAAVSGIVAALIGSGN
ncbi:alanine--tRNA ligase [Desulfofustis limnaeus]|jgi:alanyl-tRNA synthetase|uniref:Alanine--tRNA ligase n=1 Tax=Desulfofustis limnaeus TaxID=2740163 RepID=A0ABN6M1S3_9BACT|nr:alanine--tRNA ligase [Desulfofustis limnaeus]MDX9893835.1 alanine--tRNA ligase [Desulfofustis sp.]BDD85785.1 alanine--tRNA ligase [Desulfofustis limnaeus]